ncbi:NUDIX domain-containing protein [Streptomyces sp. NPDC006197]|uniref:NUDIX hydrolase n=1 Tax=Streptomyces sp. NPDC006197 TaxID=3156685 RepID=UPI0033B29832
MPPVLSRIRTLVASYLDRHPGERDALAGLLTALDTDDDPTDRSTLPGHVTCSAVVIDRNRRVLHIRHRATGGLLLAPGGHVEADDDTLLAAALREAEEETGIPSPALVLTPEFRDDPIDIDVHDIAPDPTKGEPAHRHYDFRFVFYLADDTPGLALQVEEVTDAVWLPFDKVSSPTLRDKLAASALDGAIVPVNASAIVHARTLLGRHAAEHPAPADGPAAGAGTAPAKAPPGTVPNVVGVHLYLEQDGQVLLGLRHPDSAYAGGSWHVLAGHCEAEAATACLVREAYEEAGLVIDPAGVELVHTVHMVDRPGGRPRIGLFFRARLWEGTPELREPDKCVAWKWWSAKDLPEPIVPYTRAAIEGIQAGRTYTELGWSR